MKRMWLLVVLVSILGCLSAAQTAKTNPKTPQISVAVTATNKPAKAGSSIVIEVALTNVSAQSAWFIAIIGGKHPQDPWYTVDVRHQDGSMVTAIQHHPAPEPPLRPGEVIVDSDEGIGVELKAGETMKNKVVISDSYDLTQPGKYLVQARCGAVCGE